MAVASEIQSLNEIHYKSKIKVIFLLMLSPFLFTVAFLNFYPIGDKIKEVIKTSLKGQVCKPDFDQLHMEWFFPKVIVSGLSIPASCLDRAGAPLEFSHLTINYNIINFSPLGLPFRIDTEFGGQPISFYYVQGLSEQMVRIKDQTLDLKKLLPLMGDMKISGKVTVDLNLGLKNKVINTLLLKAQSKNLQLPPQNVKGFTTPELKLNEFYIEASSDAHPRIQIDKLIVGDTGSPVRANFKGKIDLQPEINLSPIDLVGEVAITEALGPLYVFAQGFLSKFTQKDGFYQMRVGGTLGAAEPISP